MNQQKFLPILILAAAAALAGCGDKTQPPEPKVAVADATPVAAPAAMPAPEVAAAPAAASAPAAAAAAAAPGSANLANGEKIYSATCLACHGAGVLGAPKFGDKTAWQPRIAKGIDTLHQNALAGLQMMPAKGGNAALSDQDVKDAVDYMVSKAS